jgi:hypothetical protein
MLERPEAELFQAVSLDMAKNQKEKFWFKKYILNACFIIII